MGCDFPRWKFSPLSSIFQSTHPVWGATRQGDVLAFVSRISIHAPRMGCDFASSKIKSTRKHFNPRTPYGVRPRRVHLWTTYHNFNPRTPYGVRLGTVTIIHKAILISIHAPRMGCDPARRKRQHRCYHFNPRTPYGVRPLTPCGRRSRGAFQSTHPVWGATS